MRAILTWAARALYYGIGFGLLSALLTHDDWTRSVEKGLIFGLFVPTADLLARRLSNRRVRPSY
jgi:hypothetical protein